MSHSINQIHCRRAFTLVEVTISVALGLVLMLGIAQVFRVSGDAIGTGQALAGALQNARAAQSVLARDLNGTVRDGGPFMILYSHQLYAYRNLADQQGDGDGSITTLNEGPGAEQQVYSFQNSIRTHRTDCLNLFSRGNFQRQTGAQVVTAGTTSTTPFIASMSCNEANIWYGHVKQPGANNTFATGTTNSPGAALATNPYNYFADDWILGRVQMLMTYPTQVAANGSLTAAPIYDSNGNLQYAYTGATATPTGIEPLAYTSTVKNTSNQTALTPDTGFGTFTTAQLILPRVDIAQMSIAKYFGQLQSFIGVRGILSGSSTYNKNWYTNLMRTDDKRYYAIPAITSKPITPQMLAYTTPVLIKGCTQFIVEYAGDYLNQNPTTGVVTDTYVHLLNGDQPPTFTAVPTIGTTDGQVDFEIINGQKKIRWYGMPRRPSGGPIATVAYPATDDSVLPLRDVWKTSNGTAPGYCAPFEVDVANLISAANYNTAGITAAGRDYTCIWGPTDPKPKMLRITMVVDDPQGRLGDGQTYEYIFTLP